MAIERPPAPTVGSPDTLRKYRPPSDEIARYHVTQAGRKETLETVARVNSISVKELIAFNFPDPDRRNATRRRAAGSRRTRLSPTRSAHPPERTGR